MKKLIADANEKTTIANNGLDRAIKADAETITDEELSATIDENSGLIRFTLRKRRNNQDACEQTSNQQQANINDDNTLNISNQAPLDATQNENIADGHYEVGLMMSQDNNDDKYMSSAAKKSKLTSHVSFDSTSLLQQAQHRTNRRFSEIDSTRECKLPPTSEFGSWFSSKLAGLIEYEPRFVSNGFDNLQFMNHPNLMSDHLLKSIGIDNESHRMLILETIKQNLPIVDFKTIISVCSSENGDHEMVTSIGQLLQLLKLDYLIETSEFNELCTRFLNDKSAIELLRCRSMENLNLAHRIRLSLALDEIDNLNEFKLHAKSKQEPILTQQSSIESTTSNDISQSSSDAICSSSFAAIDDIDLTSHETSSSSDLQSIKSVVSIKAMPLKTTQNNQEKCEINAETNIAQAITKSTETLCNEIVASPIEENSTIPDDAIQSICPKIEENIETKEEIIELSNNQSNPIEKIDQFNRKEIVLTDDANINDSQPSEKTTGLLKKQTSSNRSLVSQVARRIEEENARFAQSQQHNISAPIKPIAAIRSRFNQPNLAQKSQQQLTTSSAKESTNCNKENDLKAKLTNANNNIVRSSVGSVTVTDSKFPKPNQQLAANIGSSLYQGNRLQANSKVTTQFGPKVTTVLAQPANQMGFVAKPKSKLDEIRMSFERQIEENAASTTTTTMKHSPNILDRSAPFRPKPPPPAKPANLIQVSNKIN